MTACIIIESNSIISASSENFRCRIADTHICRRRCESATRAACNGLDAARAWPSVDPTSFSSAEMMAIISTRFQWSASAMDTAYESCSDSPATHSTNPPGIDRHAEPDPSRASLERAAVSSSKPPARLAARARAAKAEAEEAIPVPAGKLLTEITRANSTTPAIRRTMLRNWATRTSGFPVSLISLMVSSSSVRWLSNSTVVVVNSSARFIEIEPFTGRRSTSSRFPQYLMKAILGWAKAVDLCIGFIIPHQCRLFSCFALYSFTVRNSSLI